MALLENRVRINHSRSRFISSLAILSLPKLPFAKIFGASSIFLVLTTVLSTSLAPVESIITDFNGIVYSYAINPTRLVVANTVNYVTNAVNFNNLHSENINLKLENHELQSLLLKIKTISIENEKLKKIAHISDYSFKDAIKARLVYTSSGDENNLAVVSAGSKSGVAKNNIVISNGILVGRIVSTGENFSKILLVNSPNSRIPVIAKDSNVKAILSGSGNDSGNDTGHLFHVNKRSKPVVGEVVETSGDGALYPRGIAIGKVASVTEGNISIKLLSDIDSIEHVEIIDPAQFLK